MKQDLIAVSIGICSSSTRTKNEPMASTLDKLGSRHDEVQRWIYHWCLNRDVSPERTPYLLGCFSGLQVASPMRSKRADGRRVGRTMEDAWRRQPMTNRQVTVDSGPATIYCSHYLHHYLQRGSLFTDGGAKSVRHFKLLKMAKESLAFLESSPRLICRLGPIPSHGKFGFPTLRPLALRLPLLLLAAPPLSVL